MHCRGSRGHESWMRAFGLRNVHMGLRSRYGMFKHRRPQQIHQESATLAALALVSAMVRDNTNPSEVAFWKNRLQDRTLLTALAMYPDHARRMFGHVPVMRKSLPQLSLI